VSSGPDPEEPPIRFTDNRRVDRDAATSAGGADVPPAASETPGAGPSEAGDLSDVFDDATEIPLDENAQLLQERTLDLQRLSAEYANYRKRADRERLAAGELAVGRTLAELLPVVDDLDRAKAHGDLSGALKAVADKLDAAFGKLGLVSFGEVGDTFDPSLHEAVLHDESDTVAVPTCTTVMRVGYRLGERLLRPAMVGVTDPSNPGQQQTQADSTPQQAQAPTAQDASDGAQASPTAAD